MTYSDIPISDLEGIRDSIEQKDSVQLNLAGDRCIIKWLEGHECIDELNCIHRTNAQAIAYYSNPINGWNLEEII